MRPVYVMQEVDGQNVTDAVLQKADGIVIRTKWATIEPSKGKFNLKWVQAQLARAKRFNKKVQLEVLAGDDAPLWLANNGCQVFKFSGGQIPVPWDGDFIAFYRAMLEKIKKDLDWSMVTHFHLPGANNAEWHYSQFSGFYKVAGFSDMKLSTCHKALAYYAKLTVGADGKVLIVANIGDHDRAWTQKAINELVPLGVGFQMCALKADTPINYKGYTRIKDLGDNNVPVGFEMIGPSVTRAGAPVDRFKGPFSKAIEKANKTKAQWLIVYQDDLRYMPF